MQGFTPEDFEEWTDEELTKEWNRLETLKLSWYVENKMDAIENVLFKIRRIYAWNGKGEIIDRENSIKKLD